MNLDRTKEGQAAFAKAQFPRDLYSRLWGGVVVSQLAANSFDFQPDDPRIPGLSGIPIRLPFPGFSLTLDAMQTPRALLGWENGNPALPQLLLWESPGLEQLGIQASQKVSVTAPEIDIGGDSNQAVLGTAQAQALGILFELFSTAFSSLSPGPITPAQVAAFQAAAQGITVYANAPVLSPIVRLS